MKGDDNIKNCNKGNILKDFLQEHDKFKCCNFKYINSNNTSETIEIGDVKTVNYDEEAKIIDNKNGNVHILSFYIPRGNPGPTTPSSTEGIFFSDFNELTSSGKLIYDNVWSIPNDTEIFNIIDESKVKVIPGIYEISISGLVTGIDDNNSAEIYLLTDTGAAIKDLNFKFPKNSGSQSYFSKTTLFRFEEETYLEINTNIMSDLQTSTITISEVNLLLKKIHE